MKIYCFECGKEAAHNHHVVPQVLGGTRTVPLCLDCHGKVHGRKMAHAELVMAGIAAAKAEGKKWGGRKPGSNHKTTPEVREQVRRMVEAKTPVAKIGRLLNLSRTTVYAILGEAE